MHISIPFVPQILLFLSLGCFAPFSYAFHPTPAETGYAITWVFPSSDSEWEVEITTWSQFFTTRQRSLPQSAQIAKVCRLLVFHQKTQHSHHHLQHVFSSFIHPLLVLILKRVVFSTHLIYPSFRI